MTLKRMTLGGLVLALLLALGYAVTAVADGIPSKGALTYSGVVEDASGPLGGVHGFEVVLSDASQKVLCSSRASVLVTAGRFTVPLEDACEATVAKNPNVWVNVLVDDTDTGPTKVGAVPYAVEAGHAASASAVRPGTWMAPTFEGTWANYRPGTGWVAAGYMKDAMGVVHLRGLVANLNINIENGTSIFTLPDGYRPTSGTAHFAAVATDKPAKVQVQKTGQVTFWNAQAAWVSLDGITFDTQ